MTAKRNKGITYRLYNTKPITKSFNFPKKAAKFNEKIDSLINSMTYDDLLEASKLSTYYLHGEKAEVIKSLKAKSYYNIVESVPNIKDAYKLNNKVNDRLVYLNKKRHPVTQQSINLYKKLMGE